MEAPGEAQYLTFTAMGEEFGLELVRVREIIQPSGITRVPAAPEFIRGVINLRGRVVPVLDLALKWGKPETVIDRWACVVLLEVAFAGEPLLLGVLSSVVSDVLELEPGAIEPAPSFGTGVRVEFLTGVAKTRDQRIVLLLDVDKLLSAGELSAGSAAATQPEVTSTPAMGGGER